MVREMTKKHLAAINRGRKAAGLKPIRKKKKTKEKSNSNKKKLEFEQGVLHGQVGGINQKDMKQWLIDTIKTREKNQILWRNNTELKEENKELKQRNEFLENELKEIKELDDK